MPNPDDDKSNNESEWEEQETRKRAKQPDLVPPKFEDLFHPGLSKDEQINIFVSVATQLVEQVYPSNPDDKSGPGIARNFRNKTLRGEIDRLAGSAKESYVAIDKAKIALFSRFIVDVQREQAQNARAKQERDALELEAAQEQKQERASQSGKQNTETTHQKRGFSSILSLFGSKKSSSSSLKHEPDPKNKATHTSRKTSPHK